jgi:ssDNA-binding Zn-finger/Zn-ribbon topoisomerase 1
MAVPKRICDECSSCFEQSTSRMTNLCAECAHLLYGCPKCEHAWALAPDGSRACSKCGWNGTLSAFLRGRVAPTDGTDCESGRSLRRGSSDRLASAAAPPVVPGPDGLAPPPDAPAPK